MTSPGATPPAPTADRDTAHFWEGVANSELRLQRCGSCGALRHPPGPMCPGCGSFEWSTSVASGRGTVYSAVIARYPELPGFQYPYVVALIELAEGPRMVANVRGSEPGEVHIGDPVELFFEDHGDFQLPQFRLAREEGA